MEITLTSSAKKEIEKAVSKIKGNSVPRVFLAGCG
jgi:Fe-S cluster assembly iron-binding protein IscA